MSADQPSSNQVASSGKPAQRQTAIPKRPPSSLQVANYFIALARGSNQSLSPLKLLSIVYFAHGWCLALYDRPLIYERVAAGEYGPVIASLYHEFKRYGNGPIQDYGRILIGNELCAPHVDPNATQTRALLDRVWEVYRAYTAVQLSNLAHKEGSPWHKTWGESGVPVGTTICDAMIRTYFRAQS